MKATLILNACLISLGLGLGLYARAAHRLMPMADLSSKAQLNWVVAPKAFAAMAARHNLKLTAKLSKGSLGLYPVTTEVVAQFSELIHDEKNRCGGMLAFETYEAAQQSLLAFDGAPKAGSNLGLLYKIDQTKTVEQGFSHIQKTKVEQLIHQLSTQYKNRFFLSQDGKQAALWLADHWKQLSAHRSDVKVEVFQHKLSPQPSIIMTIQGQQSDVVMLTAHVDSISDDAMSDPEEAHAPGADDNASGIATLTETARVLMEMNYKPAKTIKLVAFAAEEVGLVGSQELSARFKREKLPIIGSVNFDMVTYNGSNEDIVLMKDGTDNKQNAFLAQLIQQYQPLLKVGYDKCGYACSDHFNMQAQGFPTSMPSEARMDETNPKIHSADDIYIGDVSHALKFVRLALSFVLELDR